MHIRPQLNPIFRRTLCHGHTLVELLISCVVVSLLLLFLISIFDSISATYQMNSINMSSLGEARFALDKIGSDLALRPNRSDLPINIVSQAGNDALNFYARVPSPLSAGGSTSDVRGVALTAYRIVANGTTADFQLERAVNGISWSSANPLVFVSASPSSTTGLNAPLDADFDVAADAVFRLEFNVIDATGHIKASAPADPYDFKQNVMAVVVTVAALDSKSRLLLHDPSQQFNKLIGQLSDAQDGQVTASLWSQALENSTALSQATGIPKQVLAAVRISTRTYRVE